MRKVVFVGALAILAWIFLVPSCSSKFGCAAAGVAHADDDKCPSSLEVAAGNRSWAAAQLATIRDKKETVGLLYDEDGNELELTSAKNSDSRLAQRVISDLGGPELWVADHVEVKAAAIMRENGISHAVLVINKQDGVCALDDDGEPQPFSCQAVVPAILPEGSTLYVWSPLELQEQRAARKLQGVAGK